MLKILNSILDIIEESEWNIGFKCRNYLVWSIKREGINMKEKLKDREYICYFVKKNLLIKYYYVYRIVLYIIRNII